VCPDFAGLHAYHRRNFPVRPIQKSQKLANVCYDIRGPVLEKAKQMEDEGHKIIKLNIGNLAVFNFDPPDEIVQDMIRNMHNAAGYTDSKACLRRENPSCITRRKNLSVA
jgi:alanine-synthesizing transaminase